jgi:serine O-acetyltransferase
VIKTFKDFKTFVFYDLAQRKMNFSIKVLINPLTRFHIALRFYEFLINNNSVFRFLFKIYFDRLSIRLGFSIPPNVFDYGMCIVHYGNIVINPNARIGKNCRIHVGVNIGGKAGFYAPDIAKTLCPIIGDNCYIGPGAKIFGPVIIADNCSIGANSVVTKSCSIEDSVLVGIPAKRIEKNEKN